MAKPDKASLKKEGEALKTIIAQARKKPLNFALLQGKEGMVLETHIKKNPEMLRKEAKKRGGGPKFAMGTMRVESKTVVFFVAEAPPGPFVKLTRKFLMARGLPMQVVFRLPNGAVIGEAEDGGETAAAAPRPTPAPSEPEAAATGPAEATPEDAKQPKADAEGESLFSGLSHSYEGLLSDFEAVKDGLDMKAHSMMDDISSWYRGSDLSKGIEGAKQDISDFGKMLVAAKDKMEVEASLYSIDMPDLQKDALRDVANTRPEIFEATIEAFDAMDAALAPLEVSRESVDDLEKDKNKLQEAISAKDAERDLVDRADTAAMEARLTQSDNLEKAKFAAANTKKAVLAFKEKIRTLSPEQKAALTPAQLAKIKENLAKLVAREKAAEAAEKAAIAAVWAAEKIQDATGARLEKQERELDDLFAEQASIEDQIRKVESTLTAKKNLSLSLDGGLLSPSAPNPLSEEDVKKMVAAYGVSPAFGEEARKLIGTTDNRKNLLEGVTTLTHGAQSEFPDSDGNKFSGDASVYAKNALRMGNALGGDYFADMNAYIAKGGMNEQNPIMVAAKEIPRSVEQSTAAYMGEAMLGPDGKINVGSDKAKAAFDAVNFNPGQLEFGMPAMNMHFAEMAKSLNDPANKADCQKALDSVSVPPVRVIDPLDTSPEANIARAKKSGEDSGRALVAKNLGLQPEDVTDADVKSAVMAAMFTPLDQGSVGSCFATAPARRVREKDPDKAMLDMIQIATKGTFTAQPKAPATSGNDIPAVRLDRLPEYDNYLMRSWEYSIATAGAQLSNSHEQKHLLAAILGGASGSDDLDAIKGLLPDGADWATIRQDLEDNIKAELTFRYNATSDIPDTSSDGSSTQGNFEILDRETGDFITTKAAFIKVITRIAINSTGMEGNAEVVTKITNLCKSDAFITAISPKDDLPWQIDGGGFEAPMMTVLEGGAPATNDILAKAPSGQRIGARTKDVTTAVLKELAKGLGGDNQVLISTGGMHVFGGLPNEPSLQKLLKDPAKIEQAMQDILLDPGKKIAEAKMPEAKAVLLFQEAMDDAKLWGLDESGLALLEEARAKGPTEDMIPKDVQTTIQSALASVKSHEKRQREEAWKKEQTDAGVRITPAKFQAEQAKIEAKIAHDVRDRFAESAVTQLGAPEIVLADTNWGSKGNHIYFVVIPNPVTGALKMFTKQEPSGDLTALDDEWLETNWEATK